MRNQFSDGRRIKELKDLKWTTVFFLHPTLFILKVFVFRLFDQFLFGTILVREVVSKSKIKL
jgi:hypothetical protein